MICCFAAAAFICYLTIWFENGHLLEYAESPGKHGWILALAISWISAIVAAFAGTTLANQLLFNRGAALWIESGNLIFLHRWILSARCRDILEIASGTTGQTRHKAILLRMRDGSTKAIPTGALKEPRDVVLLRLTNELNRGG
jgi:hypothetical protein